MGSKTSIEWTRDDTGAAGATWTPLVADLSEFPLLLDRDGQPIAYPESIDGYRHDASRWACIRKSPGCDNCYAAKMNVHYGGSDFAPVGAKAPNVPVRVNLSPSGDASISAPDRWKRPRTIFVCSMTDWAGEWVEPIAQEMILDVAWRNPRHTFQFLTKRPDVSLRALEDWLRRNGLERAPDHMWFGTTIEMQSLAWRAEALGQHRAAVRFVSAEPLIGRLTLSNWMMPRPRPAAFEWLIVGGESGPGARPMHPDWARLLRDEARTFDVAFYFKQWGNWSPTRPPIGKGGRSVTFNARGQHYTEAHVDDPQTGWNTPGMTTLYRWTSKHDAGRTLDGQTHDGVPARPWMREAVPA